MKSFSGTTSLHFESESAPPTGLVGYVCQQGNNIGIAIPIHFRGGSQAQVTQMVNAIQAAWTGKFGVYNVRAVVVLQSSWDKGNSNGIAITNGADRSWVHAVDMNWGEWFSPGQWGDATPAHEAGHLLGLPDHGLGIMGNNLSGARVTEQNIREVLSYENEAIRRDCGCK